MDSRSDGDSGMLSPQVGSETSRWRAGFRTIELDAQHAYTVLHSYFSFSVALYTRSGAGGIQIEFSLFPPAAPLPPAPPPLLRRLQVLFKDADVGLIPKEIGKRFG